MHHRCAVVCDEKSCKENQITDNRESDCPENLRSGSRKASRAEDRAVLYMAKKRGIQENRRTYAEKKTGTMVCGCEAC